MRDLTISRKSDAELITKALQEKYTAYILKAVKPPKAQLWRISVTCQATGAFLTYYKA